MTENRRLQRIRDLGVRLHELRLVSTSTQQSYAGAALNFLFREHELQRPSGVPLEVTLLRLAQGLALKYDLPFRPDPDKVIDYFCRQYQVH
ncbi:hypothetical protein [Rheinheimera sp.]|uniref:hypothetical protein n=1 Tax=Rheinheimera sp. TaxID=1869214 RepID=UPI003AF88F67